VFLAIPVSVGLLLVGRGRRLAYLGRVWPTLIGGLSLLGFLVWAGYGVGLFESQIAFQGRNQFTDVLIPNLEIARQWLWALLTPPVALLTMVASVVGLFGVLAGARVDTFLALLLALAVLPSALVSRTWYPSYLLFATVPTSLLLGRAIAVAVSAAVRLAAGVSARLIVPIRYGAYVGAAALLMAVTAPLDIMLITRPQAAALPPAESSRYVSGGLSGYGLPELADYLRAQSQVRPVNVVRFDLVQPPKDGLDVYLSANDAIHLHTIDPVDKRATRQLASMAATRRTLFVSNPEAEESLGVERGGYIGKAERVWVYQRPGGQTRLEVWEIGPEPGSRMD